MLYHNHSTAHDTAQDDGLAREQKLAHDARSQDVALQELLVEHGVLAAPRERQAPNERTERLRDALKQELPEEIASEAEMLWQNAEELRWTLAMTAWRLAEHAAYRIRIPQLSNDDVVNEAAVGLYEAAKRFDPAAGCRFSTYARWWIRAKLKEALSQSQGVVRLPDSARRHRSRLAACRSRLGALKRRPTNREVAAKAGLSMRRADSLRRPQRVVAMHEADRDGYALQDTLSDNTYETPDNRIASAEDRAALRQALQECHGDFHGEILLRRFGMKGPRPTLKELGAELGCTGERVRQLEREELAALRQRIAVLQGQVSA